MLGCNAVTGKVEAVIWKGLSFNNIYKFINLLNKFKANRPRNYAPFVGVKSPTPVRGTCGCPESIVCLAVRR